MFSGPSSAAWLEPSDPLRVRFVVTLNGSAIGEPSPSHPKRSYPTVIPTCSRFLLNYLGHWQTFQPTHFHTKTNSVSGWGLRMRWRRLRGDKTRGPQRRWLKVSMGLPMLDGFFWIIPTKNGCSIMFNRVASFMEIYPCKQDKYGISDELTRFLFASTLRIRRSRWQSSDDQTWRLLRNPESNGSLST